MIGEGSFGKVFEIQREDFGTVYKAALKAITIPISQSEVRSVMSEGMDENSVRSYFGGLVQDLVQEFALMSKLKGKSNIVSYEDHMVIPHEDGIGWDILIRMELLTPLNDYMQTHPLGRQDVIQLGLDMCHALELCEKQDILHRDLKPENIFVTDDGDFKLGDFGIARTAEKTTSGLSKKGTYTYIAPEVYKGESYGKSVDIYSLGIVLYRLLNGNRAPFLPPVPEIITPSVREEALAKRLSGEPLPPPRDADPELAQIVLKACAYQSHDRYATAAQMCRELESLLNSNEPVQETITIPDNCEKTLEDVTVSAFPQQPKLRQPVPEPEEATRGIWNEPSAKERSKLNTARFKWPLLAAVGIVALCIAIGIGTSSRSGKNPDTSTTPKSASTQTTPVITAPNGTTLKEAVPAGVHVMVETEKDPRSDQWFWGQTTYRRRSVRAVTFRSSLEGVPTSAWDVSEAGDKSVLAWMDTDRLYVAANGKIAPNPNASWMFAYFENLTEIDFGDCFDTTNVANLKYMFANCWSLNSLDVSGFNTSNVINMSHMFSECGSLSSLDVSGFDTSNVADMSYMFNFCRSLDSVDVSGFETANVTLMRGMFNACDSLSDLDVTGFDTSNVTSMGAMFSGCNDLSRL